MKMNKKNIFTILILFLIVVFVNSISLALTEVTSSDDLYNETTRMQFINELADSNTDIKQYKDSTITAAYSYFNNHTNQIDTNTFNKIKTEYTRRNTANNGSSSNNSTSTSASSGTKTSWNKSNLGKFISDAWDGHLGSTYYSDQDIVDAWNYINSAEGVAASKADEVMGSATNTWYQNLNQEINKRESKGYIKKTSTMLNGATKKYKYQAITGTEAQQEAAKEYEETNKKEYESYTPEQILEYLSKNSNVIPAGCEEIWRQKLTDAYNAEPAGSALKTQYGQALQATSYAVTKSSDIIYTNLPERTSDPNSAEQSLDDMMNDADSFINNANKLTYEPSKLENFSKTLYNIFLSVGIVISVLVGGFIGIKLMTSSVEEKAEYKKLLIPYVVGCIIVFGGFAIWKLVVTILQGI